MPKGLKEEKIDFNRSAEDKLSGDNAKVLKFGQESLNWIYEEKLENDANFQKLIKLFDRIIDLDLNDPRKDVLIDMWESEINKLYKRVISKKQEPKSSKKEDTSNTKSNIDGWKERLNIKTRSSTPDSLREQLMRKLNSSDLLAGRDTKDDIMLRAGMPDNRKEIKLDYVARGKNAVESGIDEIDNILDDIDQTNEIPIPDSILKNDIIEARDYTAAVGFTVDLDENDKANMDSSFNFNGESQTVDDLELQGSVNEFKEVEFDKDEFNPNKTLTNELDLSNAIDINYETIELSETQNESIFDKISDPELVAMREQQKEADSARREEEYSKINPDKRNILDKSDFSFFDRDNVVNKFAGPATKNNDEPKPFHEIRPVGSYGMIYDVSKQPSMQNLLNEYKQDNEIVDEMNDKLEFLRDLQTERKHRVNLMHIERNNSFIVARSNRLKDRREKKRLKDQEAINLKALERQERLRRLQERQKLIQLMKERQMKRSEEKRVSSILQMERERRLVKNNQYREQIAAIDEKIRFEQESIKNAELKMKAYFTQASDPKLFDDSIKIAREFSKYAVSDEKINALKKFEDEKRQKRIERLSQKFVKNKK